MQGQTATPIKGVASPHQWQCILLQDATSLVSAMPVPLFRLRDEICGILVGSSDTEVTHDMLRKSPLLVRWEKIRTALFWLIDNNPLYTDLNNNAILENPEEYPVYDCPLAIAGFLRTNSANNQGSSYTSYSDQANIELYEGSDTFELVSTTLVGVDSMNSTYKQRKLDALLIKDLVRKIDSNSMDTYQAKLEKNPFAKPESEETPFDNDGDLVIRCENGQLNGHNPTATLCLGRNTDLYRNILVAGRGQQQSRGGPRRHIYRKIRKNRLTYKVFAFVNEGKG
ncbi:hypothetical protein C8J57DRAFT_1234478 [Mycena rebaudengoi]|nr:hypothetical protein C8J57DRAFT_1234478 [Mycena rebaudengoi]